MRQSAKYAAIAYSRFSDMPNKTTLSAVVASLCLICFYVRDKQ